LLGQSGEYFEDFEDQLAQDWLERIPTNWNVVAGEYRADTTTSSTVMQSVYTGNTWQDCSAQVVVRRIGYMSSSVWLIVRATDDFSEGDGTGSAYSVAISGNGYYHVGKYVNGSFTFIQDWTTSPYLNMGETPNIITVNIEGFSIEVYLNGNLTFSGTDLSITEAGRIGLMGYNSSSYDHATYYFDNVYVSQVAAALQEISPEQQWYNEYAYEDGIPSVAPENFEPPEYPDDPTPIRRALPEAAPSSVIRLENVPPTPLVIPPLRADRD